MLSLKMLCLKFTGAFNFTGAFSGDARMQIYIEKL